MLTKRLGHRRVDDPVSPQLPGRRLRAPSIRARQHSTNAVTSSNIQEPELVSGAGTPSQSVEGIVHRYSGRTEVQRLSINPSNGRA
jgi:hypothetical protein